MNQHSILIVEDEYIIAKNLQIELQNLGYNVCGIASSGQQALNLAIQKKPDLILMDIIIKGPQDGIETAEKIHETQDIPIIFVTAYGDKKIIDRVKKTSPMGYLIKPVMTRELHASVEMALYKAYMDTKLKNSETRFRELVEHIREMFFTVDVKDKNLTYVSPACPSIFPFSAHELQKKPDRVLDIIFSEDLTATKQLIEKTIESPKPVKHNFRVLNEDGSIRWINGRAYPIMDSNNEPVRIVGIADDITEQKTLEEELIQAKKQAEDNEKIKTNFLARISHELRTPLNAILGYTQLFNIKKDHLDDFVKEGIDIIHTSSESLLTLINNILDLSNIETKKLSLIKEPFNLLGLLNEISYIAKNKITYKNIVYEPHFSNDLPQDIIADKQRLRQILLNLILNAIKFTEHGHVKFYVENNKNKISFKIQDTGVGIPSSQLPLIFKPFHQVDILQTHAEGTGLGLAISQQLVQLMGGELNVESQPGKGSIFYFSLVLPKTTIKPSTSELIDEKIQVNHDEFQGAGKKVLIVDDIHSNRFLLRSLLSRYGFEISEASNGYEAIDLAQVMTPDIIFMDIFMPKMNGIEAIKKLREISSLKNSVIIAVSANHSQKIKNACLEMGVSEFIEKPLNVNNLLDILATLSCRNNNNKNQTHPCHMAQIPKKKLLDQLKNNAMMGNYSGLKETSQKIIELDSAYQLFIDRILEWTNKYQFKQIIQYIDTFDSTNM